jgi:pimeloyl-ACP methyl ester carboxylesterase
MVVLLPLAAAGAAAAPWSCEDVTVPVSLSALSAAKYAVAGTLCRPSGWGAGQDAADVDVLVPGATYTRLYWDWPLDPQVYSFVDATLQAGRATFAVDRIGSGASSHPTSALLSVTVDAFVLHQLVGWLRSSAGARQVTVVGHSLGSGVAVYEAAQYHDTDRLVVTGLLHSTGSRLVTALASFRPAALMAPFRGLGYDLGYLSTAPGARFADFYSATADPAIVAYDELHKDVVSGAEMGDYPTLLTPPALDVTRHVDVPVLEVAGQLDALLCGGSLDCSDLDAVQAHEAAFYPAASSVTTLTVPWTGHDVALHPSAPDTFAAIDRWIAAH